MKAIGDTDAAAALAKPTDGAVKATEANLETEAGRFVTDLGEAEGTAAAAASVEPELTAEVAQALATHTTADQELLDITTRLALLQSKPAFVPIGVLQQGQQAPAVDPLARTEAEETTDLPALQQQHATATLRETSTRAEHVAAQGRLVNLQTQKHLLDAEVPKSKGFEQHGTEASAVLATVPEQDKAKSAIAAARGKKQAEADAARKAAEPNWLKKDVSEGAESAKAAATKLPGETAAGGKSVLKGAYGAIGSGLSSLGGTLRKAGRGLLGGITGAGIGAGIGAALGAIVGSAGAGAAVGAALGGMVGMRMGNQSAAGAERKPVEDELKAAKKEQAGKERELELLKKEQEAYAGAKGAQAATAAPALAAPDPYPAKIKTAETAVEAAKKKTEEVEKKLAALDKASGKKEMDAPKKK